MPAKTPYRVAPPVMAVLAIGLLAVADMALHPAHAQKRQAAQAETHNCPAGTKWKCETRPNTSRSSDRSHPLAPTKVCGCN